MAPRTWERTLSRARLRAAWAPTALGVTVSSCEGACGSGLRPRAGLWPAAWREKARWGAAQLRGQPTTDVSGVLRVTQLDRAQPQPGRRPGLRAWRCQGARESRGRGGASLEMRLLPSGGADHPPTALLLASAHVFKTLQGFSVLFWGSPGLPSRAVPSEAVERGRQQRGGAARGSGAQAAGLQAAGKGHTCPRPLQPSGRESRRGPAPGTRGLKGRHGERGFGAMAEAGCRKGSAELPWELGAPAPGGSLSREDRTRPQLRLAAPAPLPWGRAWTVSLAAHGLRGTEPRGRKDPEARISLANTGPPASRRLRSARPPAPHRNPSLKTLCLSGDGTLVLKGTHSPEADRSGVGGLGLPDWSAQGPAGLSGARPTSHQGPGARRGRAGRGPLEHGWLRVGLWLPDLSLSLFTACQHSRQRHSGGHRPRAGRRVGTSGVPAPEGFLEWAGLQQGFRGGAARPRSLPLLE